MKKYIAIIIVILVAIFLTLIFCLKPSNNATKIPVITFHRLVPDVIKNTKYKDNVWVGSITIFENMMKYLYDNEYQTLSGSDLFDWLNNKRDLPKKSVMITFDDGFYEDYYLVYPILKKYNFNAITFVVGSRIKDVTEEYSEDNTAYIGLDKIMEIRNDYPKFEIQSHTYNLHYYTKNGKHVIESKTKEEIKKDFDNNQKYNFTVMAYPFGDYNNIIEEVLEENNYYMAFRFSPSGYVTKDSDIYALPRIKIDGTKGLNDLKKWLE